ncbi:putative WRKY transcription factor 19, partial [Globisporangium polare]
MNFGSFARYLPASITSSASPPTTCSDFTSSTASDAAGAPTRKGALSFILSPPSSPEPAASLNLQAPGLMMTPIKTIIKRKRTESADLATSMQQLKATCPGVGSFSPSAAIKIEHIISNDIAAPPPPQAPMKKSSKFCVVDGCMSRAKH